MDRRGHVVTIMREKNQNLAAVVIYIARLRFPPTSRLSNNGKVMRTQDLLFQFKKTRGGGPAMPGALRLLGKKGLLTWMSGHRYIMQAYLPTRDSYPCCILCERRDV